MARIIDGAIGGGGKAALLRQGAAGMKQLGFLLALGLCAISGTAAAAGDAAAGQAVRVPVHRLPFAGGAQGRSRVCMTCMAAVGTAQGFGYTPTLEQAGFTWNAEKLDAFLSGPMNFLPGTAMAFGGLRKQDDRQNIICFLEQQNRSWS
ncbi:cytochrome C [Pseudomonas aeruginosa]|nr:cytochrome C [Pseudomonas aeruginosa]